MQLRVFASLLANLPLVGRHAAYAPSDKLSTQFQTGRAPASALPIHHEASRHIYTTRRIEELASHVGELGEEKISEEIRHDVRQIEEHAKAIERMRGKRRPIAIDWHDKHFHRVRAGKPHGYRLTLSYGKPRGVRDVSGVQGEVPR
jgi:hypothetical protein